MASAKVCRILRSKGAPFSASQLKSMSDAEGWRWIYAQAPPKEKRKGPKPLEVCFTGFRPDEKAELRALAEGIGMVVRSRMTKDLDMLCCGEDPGPVKLRQAEQRNLTILSAEEFIEFRDQVAEAAVDVREAAEDDDGLNAVYDIEPPADSAGGRVWGIVGTVYLVVVLYVAYRVLRFAWGVLVVFLDLFDTSPQP